MVGQRAANGIVQGSTYRHPDLNFVVRNEGGRLTLECIGQKVELFPESETSFFVKPFYGEFMFIKDEAGKVTHLDSRVRGRNGAATSLHAKKLREPLRRSGVALLTEEGS